MERCPLCGSYSFDNEPCHPRCDPGSLRQAGIEDAVADIHRLGKAPSGDEMDPISKRKTPCTPKTTDKARYAEPDAESIKETAEIEKEKAAKHQGSGI